MSNQTHNPEYVVPSPVIDEVLLLLRRFTFKTVHYLGYADESLIKSLVRAGRYTLSLMDYWDRYGREARFFADIDGIDASGVDTSGIVGPDWLEDIPSYFEGAPAHEVLLQDIRWIGGQVDLLAQTTTPQPNARWMNCWAAGRAGGASVTASRTNPICIILFGEAEVDPVAEEPIGYKWQQPRTGGLKVGFRNGTEIERYAAPRISSQPSLDLR